MMRIVLTSSQHHGRGPMQSLHLSFMGEGKGGGGFTGYAGLLAKAEHYRLASALMAI